MDRQELLQKAHKRLSTLRRMKASGNNDTCMPRGGIRTKYDTDIALMEAAIAHLKLRPFNEMNMEKVTADDVINSANALSQHVTRGRWWMDSHGTALVSFTGSGMKTIFRPMNERERPHRNEATGSLSYWENDADASWIALMQPANVMTLVEEVEMLRRESSGLKNEN